MSAPEYRAASYGEVAPAAAHADELEWIYHYAPIGLCQFDLELRFLRINETLAEINGLPASVHIGRTVHQIVPSLASAAERMAQEILATGQPVLKHEFAGETAARPGVTRYWEESWYPVFDRDGRMSGYGVVVEEVTERKQSEQTLRELLGKYELVIAGAGDAIWVWDVANHRVDYSARWKDLHGYGTDDIGDSESIWADSIHPDDRFRVMEAVKAHFEGATEIFQEDYRVRRKDGQCIWVHDRGVAMRDERGQVTRMAGSERDITEYKRAEEQLRNEARRKDDFIAMLAHELRNPLAPIHNGLTILERDATQSPKVARILPMMRRQIQNLIRLVDDLLDIARIERGKIELKKTACDLCAILRDAIETAEPHILAANQTLTVDLSPDPVALQGDPARLAQVFGNLINNASKYAEVGGHIWITAGRSDGDAIVSVRDDGCGIEPEMAAEIFKPFVQARTATSSNRVHPGLGVGLSLSKRLIDMHGGAISVRSDGPGKGAEFTVRLPSGP